MEVPDGKIVTLIGANGAGKSTTLRTISGLVKAKSGSITYNNEQLLGKPINAMSRRGHRAGSRGTARVPGYDRARKPQDRRLPAQG